jgi:branched-chain amino acid transport system ATP-binding protein
MSSACTLAKVQHTKMSTPLLQVENINAWYGRSHVIQGVSLFVNRGEIVTLMGRNGAGKTTTLRTIMGLMQKSTGSVRFDGTDVLTTPSHRRFHAGLAYVPEERRIVPGLTVRENLRLGLIASAKLKNESNRIDAIAEIFPRLKERLPQEASSLSGGEQQMLAIARAMMSEPIMILLDEPSEGIMPLLVDEMFALFTQMKQQGTTLLLVEQNVERALSISDRAYIMDQGAVVHHGAAMDLLADAEIQERYCAV